MLTDAEIIDIKECGRRLVGILAELKAMVKPGTNLLELEAAANQLASKAGGIPSFKGYHGYPAALCLSVNSTIVHGIPKDYVLKAGDILAIDMGLFYKGWHTDSALTLGVGDIAPMAARLMEGTYLALLSGTDAVRPGNRVQDISQAIEKVLRARNLTIFRQLVGHGTGRQLHLDPLIPNFDTGERGPKLTAGMLVALEPITGLGLEDTRELPDGWTIETVDGQIAAHFEHTILITPDGPEVITPLTDLVKF
ncbi:MAG: type I methionyl aminopeptidase [Patescibacteria group bacterium]